MQNDPKNFSLDEVTKLANTPAGKQLMALLKNADTSALRSAMTQATDGNMEQAKQTLAPLLASPEVQKLLRQLGGK